jgi:predicted enzyme related to lactoylglutathione lyase
MTSTGHHHGPAWFDISTPNAPRARRFYQEMFGWPVNAIDETYALVGGDDGQPTGGIGQAGPRAERLRGKEHARKPVAGSRYQGRCAGRSARYGES